MAGAVATHAGIYGVMLFAPRFLATNARRIVAGVVATHAGKYAAVPFAPRFLATNARMSVAGLWPHMQEYTLLCNLRLGF